MMYPLTLGNGKRLFADGTLPAAFKVTESQIIQSGIIIVNYERASAPKTGSIKIVYLVARPLNVSLSQKSIYRL